MGFTCGIIGLPNVGKSTLFNALTKLSAKVADFPFCTIEMNTGMVPVPDSRLDILSRIIKPYRTLPTTMKFVDVAGLIKGASKGEGLGNKFLSNIRETEAICHVVRCFENNKNNSFVDEVNTVIKDIRVVNTELVLSDLNICENAIHCISKKIKNTNKEKVKEELRVLKKCFLQLENSKMLRLLYLSKEEKKLIQHLGFLTLKPMMYVCNVSENYFRYSKHLDQVRNFAEKENASMISVCAIIEAEVAKFSNSEYKELSEGFGFGETSLNQVIKTGYDLLGLQTYFTVGTREIRAWTIPIGATAKQAAGRIHTDFEKGFIRARIISYEDFVTYKGEQGAKEAGKMRFEGKNYVVKDGDVINFLFKV